MPASFSPTHLSTEAVLARRLRLLSAIVRGLILFGTPFLLAAPLLLLGAPETLAALGVAELGGESIRPLLEGEFMAAARLRCFAVSLLPSGVWLATLWQLWQLFGRYRLPRRS